MRRFLTSAFLLVGLVVGQLAGAATVTRPFNFTLGSAYSGLASTVSYQIVLVDGSSPIGPITGTGITEGSFGAVTATGSYDVNIANFDTSWAGRIKWLESTSGLVYEETFGVSQSADNAAGIAAVKAKTDNLPASSVIRSGTAQGGSATTIVLDAGASPVDGTYVGQLVTLTGGTGAQQSQIISGYAGSTRTATITRSWSTTPDNTSTFEIAPQGAVLVGQFAPAARVVDQTFLGKDSNGVGNLTIYSQAGTPQAGLWVTFYAALPFSSNPSTANAVAQTQTDASGNWSVSVSPGDYVATVTSSSAKLSRAMFTFNLTVP